MAAVLLTFWLLVTSIFSGCTLATTVLNASAIPYEQQTYKFNRENQCRLLAHKSIVLKNEKHHLLVLDGGFGKFKFEWNDQDYEVADLNRYTAAIDLNSNFSTVGLPEFILQHPKPLPRDGGAPVVNHFGIWSDSTQNAIYIQGGHFVAFTPWNESAYGVSKPEIPENNLWRFDVLTNEWKDVTGETTGAAKTVRTFGGASCSVPALNQSFWLGGIRDPYTSATSPADTFSAQSQFLIHDHSEGRIRSETYYTPSPSEAYWHGTLDHLKVGAGKGFLISLMSQKARAGAEFPDAGPQNDERGQNVSFTGVMLYDLDRSTWYNQSTGVFTNEEPPHRTRFCSVVAHEEGSKSWELWLFGGQGLDPNQTTGTGDAWVLTMPAFIWTRINLAPANSNSDIKSHSCHAIGSQLLIIGGYWLGGNVDPNTPCDLEFIKVLDINTATWQTQYSTGTTYKVHPAVASRTALKPLLGGWAHPALEAAFSYTAPSAASNPDSPTPRSKHLSPGAIAGIVLGVLAALGAVAWLAWRFWWRRRSRLRRARQGGVVDVMHADADADADGNGDGDGDGDVNRRAPEMLPNPVAMETMEGLHQTLSELGHREPAELGVGGRDSRSD